MMRSTTGAIFTRAQIRSSIQRVGELGLQPRREAYGCVDGNTRTIIYVGEPLD